MSFTERQLEVSQLKPNRLAVSQLEASRADTRAYCGICDHVVLRHLYKGNLCWFCLNCRQMVVASGRQWETLQRSALDHNPVRKLGCQSNNRDSVERVASDCDAPSCDDINSVQKLVRNGQTRRVNQEHA